MLRAPPECRNVYSPERNIMRYEIRPERRSSAFGSGSPAHEAAVQLGRIFAVALRQDVVAEFARRPRG